MVEGNAGHGGAVFEVGVIADDEGDARSDFVAFALPDQFLETVVLAGNQHRHLFYPGGRADPNVHAEASLQGSKVFDDLIASLFGRLRHLDHDAHKEHALIGVF